MSPEELKIVQAIEPKADAAGTAGDYISLKNAHKVTVIVHITQGNSATIEIGVNEATAVAGTSAAAITKELKIWSNLDCAATDTLVKRTDAATYTTDAGVKHKQVIVEIDPGLLSAGFDCIAVTTGASNAANLVSAQYFIETRYAQATPPSAIVD